MGGGYRPPRPKQRRAPRRRARSARIPAMARIRREEVEHIAGLARLRLSEAEAEVMTRDLESILGYVAQLGELDTRDVEPTAQAIPMETPYREDRPEASLETEVALGNAPAREGAAFAVPKVLESEDAG